MALESRASEAESAAAAQLMEVSSQTARRVAELQAAVDEAAGRAARASVDAAERSRLNSQVRRSRTEHDNCIHALNSLRKIRYWSSFRSSTRFRPRLAA
jgi:hypothetical protein